MKRSKYKTVITVTLIIMIPVSAVVIGFYYFISSVNNIFELTSDLIDVAIRNARIVVRNVEAVGTDNPSTKVHELVLYMQKVKEQMESEV